MATFYGADISRWQGQPDWNTLVQHVSFMFYKGTGGDDGMYVDGDFLYNHAEARRTGISRGIYHFAGGSDNPVAEAEYFYQQCCTNLLPGEVVVLDAERGNTVDPAWALPFLNRLEQLVGFKPLIYMNLNTEHSHDWSEVVRQGYGLWLADWDGNPDSPVSLRYWPFCAFQQYANNIHVPGIEGGTGSVDGDAFFAPDMSYFAKYGKPATVAAPVVTPTPPPPAVEPVPPAQPTQPAAPPPQQPVDPGTVVSPTPPADPSTGPIINDPLPPVLQPKSTDSGSTASEPTVSDQVDQQVTVDLSTFDQLLAKIKVLKSGFKTSEFWQVAVVNVTTFVEGVVKNHVLAVRVTALAVIGVLTAVYVWSRAHVKKAAAQTRL